MKITTTNASVLMTIITISSAVVGCGSAQAEDTPAAIGSSSSSSSPPPESATTPNKAPEPAAAAAPPPPAAAPHVGQPANCRPSDETLAAPPKGEYVNDEGLVGMPGGQSVVARERVDVFNDPVQNRTIISRRLSLTFFGKPQETVDPKEGVCWTSGSVSWRVVDSRSLTNEIPPEIGVGEYTNAIDIGDSSMTCCAYSGFGVGGSAYIPEATVMIKSRTATTVEGEVKTPDANGQLRTILTFRAPFEWN